MYSIQQYMTSEYTEEKEATEEEMSTSYFILVGTVSEQPRDLPCGGLSNSGSLAPVKTL